MSKKDVFLLLVLLVAFLKMEGQVDVKKDVNAATYVGYERDIYVLKDGMYLRYDIGTDRPKSGGVFEENFALQGKEAFHKGVQAASYVGAGRDMYLFQGTAYLRYDVGADKVVSGGNIAKSFALNAHPKFHANIDAACYVGAGRDMYLFKGTDYIRYDIGKDRVVSGGSIQQNFALAGYPDFHANIDAACYVGAGRDIYLFKGEKYLRYDIGKDRVVSQGSIRTSFNLFYTGSFNAARWMTDSYSYLKDKKLNEILMTGSHNAMYVNNVNNFCDVQAIPLNQQFSWGGARYFDIRVKLEKLSGGHALSGFHGNEFICRTEPIDFHAVFGDLKKQLNNSKELVILHIKQMRQKGFSNTDKAAEFLGQLFANGLGYATIIRPSEVSKGLYAYTYEELLQRGNVIIVSEYEDTKGLSFYNRPRDANNIGKFLGFPFVSDTSSDDVAEEYQRKFLPQTTKPKVPLVVGHSGSGILLKTGAIRFNKNFYQNYMTKWVNAGYHWIHSIDFVGWDQGWSRKIAEGLMQANIQRARTASRGGQSTRTLVKSAGTPVSFRVGKSAQGKGELTIYNSRGQAVFTEEVTVDKGEVSLTMTQWRSLKSGLYFIRIRTNNHLSNHKIYIY